MCQGEFRFEFIFAISIPHPKHLNGSCVSRFDIWLLFLGGSVFERKRSIPKCDQKV